MPAPSITRKRRAASKLTTSRPSFVDRFSTLLGISRPGFGIANTSDVMREIGRADSKKWSEPGRVRRKRYNEPAVLESVMFSMMTAGG
jgi:hypothetical protein